MKLVRNETESKLTVRGHKGIPPGNVHVVSETIAGFYKEDWGDKVTVKEYEPEAHGDDEGEEGKEESEAEKYGLDWVDDYDPNIEGHQVLDNSVDDLEEELETGDYDAILKDLLYHEIHGKTRKTAVEAIKDRLQEAGEETGEADGDDSGE